MPSWLRIVLSGFCFFVFGVGSPLLGWVVFPIMRLFAKDQADHRRRCTRVLQRGQRIFAGWMRLLRLIDCPDRTALPAPLHDGQPYVMVANHPSLIDVVVLLASIDDLTCIAAGRWYHTVILGPLLRASNYLPGPGAGDDASDDMLDRMVEHLRAGHALLIFPEGRRSTPERLRRFRRGAVEAAVRAGVPLVPAFVGIDRPFLQKGVPFWNHANGCAHYTVELLEPIDTTTIDQQDTKRLNLEVQAKLAERYAQMLASQRRALPAEGAVPAERSSGPASQS